MADSGGVLFVHAHPDDEVMATGGTIARLAAEGHRVDLVTCTDGAEGEVHDPDLDPAEARPRLAQIRREELRCAVAALGDGRVHQHFLGYRDSGMMGTDANGHPESFWQADLEGATERLRAIVRAASPAAIVSYDSNGNYGHPDHINAHRVARAAFDAEASVQRFYEIAFSREDWFALMAEMQQRGIELPWDFGAEADAAGAPAADELNPTNAEALRQVSEGLEEGDWTQDFGTPEEEITTRIDIAAYAERKRQSMRCHRTQAQDLGWLLDLPADLGERALARETFILRVRRGREIGDGFREDWLLA